MYIVVIDLAVPRNVDPAARAVPNMRLCDMDDLNALAETHHPIAAQAIAAAEGIIAQEVTGYPVWWRERQIAPLVVALSSQAEEIRQAEVTRTPERLNLTPEQQEAIDALATSLTNKLLHAATRAIKG